MQGNVAQFEPSRPGSSSRVWQTVYKPSLEPARRFKRALHNTHATNTVHVFWWNQKCIFYIFEASQIGKTCYLNCWFNIFNLVANFRSWIMSVLVYMCSICHFSVFYAHNLCNTLLLTLCCSSCCTAREDEGVSCTLCCWFDGC